MIDNVYEKYKHTFKKGSEGKTHWISIDVEEPDFTGVVIVRSNRPDSLDEKYYDLLFQSAFEKEVLISSIPIIAKKQGDKQNG